MARARNIKPGLFKNEVLGVADPLYTLLFQGLWLLADRAGRLEDRPMRIRAEVFPYRDGIDMGAMLGWLEQAGFIRRYQYGGLALIEIVNFTKHQNPHKNEPDSVFPGPEEIGSDPEPLGTTSEKIGSAPADSGFLIPDSGLSKAAAAPPPPAAPPPAPPPPAAGAAARPRGAKHSRSSPIPDDFVVSERVRRWAGEKGYGQLDQHLEAFVRKCRANDYRKASWDDFFIEAIRLDWAQLRGRTPSGAAPPPDGGGGQWFETRDGVERRARELRLPAWDQLEQFALYRARIVAEHRRQAH
jgi:hypothetical protein